MQLVGVGDGSPHALDGMVVAPLEAQDRAVIEGESAEAQGRDEGSTRSRIEPEAGGVALVSLPDRLVGALLGQVFVGEVRVEPLQVGPIPR